MFRKRFSLLIMMLFLSTLSLSACTPKPEADKTLTPVKVQLLWVHQAQFAGLYAADQKGYYSDEGLAVTFLEGGVGVPHFTSVLDGSAQFGIAGADEIILTRAEGNPVKAVAVEYRRSPITFMTLADSGITKPEDFNGKQITAPANLVPALQAMTMRVGVSPNEYTVTSLPSDLAVFSKSEVPIWGVYLTGFAVVVQQAGYKVNFIYPDDYGVHFYADTLFTTDELITGNPDLVARFVRATLKGWTYAVENPNEVPAMVQKMKPTADTTIELAKMTASIPLVNTGEDFIGWMKPGMWVEMEQTLREQGVLTKPLDVTQSYTMQFLEGIYK
jgi:NitT/TauT family transport system substrate-binding protein